MNLKRVWKVSFEVTGYHEPTESDILFCFAYMMRHPEKFFIEEKDGGKFIGKDKEYARKPVLHLFKAT